MDFTSSAEGKWEDKPNEPVDLDAMYCAKTALGKVSLPPKAHLVSGKAVHMHFNGISQGGHSMGGFVNLDADSMEIIQAEQCYSSGCTNNKAKSFTVRDTL